MLNNSNVKLSFAGPESFADHICRKLANASNDAVPVVIIGGFPAICKTAICKRIEENIFSAIHLEMESYFISSRDIRRSLGLNGFDLDSYNVERIVNDFKRLRSGKSIVIEKYDHDQGFLGKYINVRNDNFLILEGFAFYCLLQMFPNIISEGYFLFPGDLSLWEKVHVERDQKERSTSVDSMILWYEVQTKLASLRNSMNKLSFCWRHLKCVGVTIGKCPQENRYFMYPN